MASRGNLISDSLLRELRKNISTVRNDNSVLGNSYIGSHPQQTRRVVRIVGEPSGDWLTSGYTQAAGFYAAEDIIIDTTNSTVITDSVYGHALSSSYPPIANLFEIDRDVLSGVPLSTNVEIFSAGTLSGNPLWYFTNENIILTPDVTTDMTILSSTTASQILNPVVKWKYNDNYDALSACVYTFVQSLSFSNDLSALISFSRDATIDNFGKFVSITPAFSAIVVGTTSCSG